MTVKPKQIPILSPFQPHHGIFPVLPLAYRPEEEPTITLVWQAYETCDGRHHEK
jgi:hypothetical protein